MRKLLLTFLALALVPLAATADEHEAEEATPDFVMATYYYCEQDEEDDADKAFEEGYAPVLNSATEAGTIDNWGWMAHRLGGKWRRIWFFTANGADKLLDAADKIYSDLGDALGDEDGVTDACPTHDDYIWEVAGGTAGEERAAVAFSIYFDCDSTREDRADEIVAASFGPTLDGMVEAGNIKSWGWLKHYVGGKTRRLMTMTAADHKASLKARDAAVDIFYAEDNAAGAEFGGICSRHVDYMWDSQLPK